MEIREAWRTAGGSGSAVAGSEICEVSADETFRVSNKTLAYDLMDQVSFSVTISRSNALLNVAGAYPQ